MSGKKRGEREDFGNLEEGKDEKNTCDQVTLFPRQKIKFTKEKEEDHTVTTKHKKREISKSERRGFCPFRCFKLGWVLVFSDTVSYHTTRGIERLGLLATAEVHQIPPFDLLVCLCMWVFVGVGVFF